MRQNFTLFQPPALLPLLVVLLGNCEASTTTEISGNVKADSQLQAAPQKIKNAMLHKMRNSDVNIVDSASKKILAPLAAEPAPAASTRLHTMRSLDLPAMTASYFDKSLRHSLYVQVDKPLYKPGETIWFKAWDLRSRNLTGIGEKILTVELISPKGATVLKKRLRSLAGGASNDFDIPAEAQGGEYKLRVITDQGQQLERSIIVSAYEAPRMKKTLEFIKKSYGAGEQVSATISVKRPTGEVLAGKPLIAVASVDGMELPRVTVTANAEGEAVVKFNLPQKIEAGDGLLTILVEDGGITESISKSIPILQNKMLLSFYPEGGKMVAGINSRIYFEAKNKLGKPADVEGKLYDDRGQLVSSFSSYKNGLGRISFTPVRGRTYHAEISKPGTITEHYPLPVAEDNGCVLRSYDDLDGKEKNLRVRVECSKKQKLFAAATMRENMFDLSSVEAGPGQPAVIYLQAKDSYMQQAAGIARVTVFDDRYKPMAERLVFRNRRSRLDIKVEHDKKNYVPRDKVSLTITTRDASGKAVPAELALSVVDDTVLSFADDKSANILSRMLLESDLPGKIEEPNFYIDLTEEKSALALDLLMGTRGYRHFEWVKVLDPVQIVHITGQVIRREMRESAAPVQVLQKKGGEPVMDAAPLPVMAAPPAPVPAPKPAPPPAPVPVIADQRKADMARTVLQKPDARRVMAGNVMPAREEAPPIAAIVAPPEYAREKKEIAIDKDFARAAGKVASSEEEQGWALVRVFPTPAFIPNYAGPRDDYRETVMWAPSVKTDHQGKATVTLTLSDAVTSFRVNTEGAGNGQLGRIEKVFKSSLPFSLSAKLPLEISAGDKPLIPVTLSNESENTLAVDLDSNFGSLLKMTGNSIKFGSVAAGQRKSLFIPLEVTGIQGISKISLSAAATGLKDEVLRSIPVVAPGFPQLAEKSGLISSIANYDIDLSKANKGSVQASIKVYTSSLSTMISGLEGMLRQPYGCFEQTSSTNYPNVMIMQYLKQHDVADAALLDRTGKLLDSGYKRLTGFESPKKGYEWFGGDPGHEALTAYGLLEFADMKSVYGEVDTAMLARTAAWLKSRRDGNGGYQKDAKALDGFGRANTAVTDAYITWALVSARETGLDKEIAKSVALAESTQDAYQLALAVGSMLEGNGKTVVAEKTRKATVEKLANMQAASGAWTNADHSITRSGGSNLHIETTSLAILAMLKSGDHLEQARKGINWLQNNRSGFGQWGATQATVLALKAMIAFDNDTRVAPKPGKVSLLIDGVVVNEQSYEAGRRDALLFKGFDQKLTPGKHTITLKSQTSDALPYSIAVEYSSNEPASSKNVALDLQTRLTRTEMKMGETVRLDAVISNKTQTGQPMSLARLGLPGGLTFQNWQLKELREKGQIAFFETRAREVILYFRDMKPGEVKKLGIDLVASVPGSYSGPASSAYLYYNDTEKAWTSPLNINITP